MINAFIKEKHGSHFWKKLENKIGNLIPTSMLEHWDIYFFFFDFPSESSTSGLASCHLTGLDLKEKLLRVTTGGQRIDLYIPHGGMVRRLERRRPAPRM